MANEAPQLLFAYGTLQDPKVQQEVFGIGLAGEADVLDGYQLLERAVYGQYPLVEPALDPKIHVKGTIYTLSPQQWIAADAYETDLYQRILLELRSGKRAWVYVKNSV